MSLAVACALAGCPAPPPPRDTGPAEDVLPPSDITATDATAMDTGAPDTGPPPPAWPHELPSARMLGAPRGLRTLRVIIHAHSVHSHDACDGDPYVDGGVNNPCLDDFRRAACQTRLDAILLTEHDALMADGAFERVMQVRAGDEPVMSPAGALVGYRIACPGGHRTLVLPGAENELMPLGLTRHPDPLAGSVRNAYNADGPEAAARFRAAGAVVAVPHTEQRTLDALRATAPDAIEIYNIHANLDPRIAGPHLGLDLGPALLDIGRWNSPSSMLEPDLVVMAFFAENGNDLGKWAALLSEGRAVPGLAGSDAHQNAFPALLRDGERGDSYRRIFRFFSNELLVPDDPSGAPPSREAVLAAVTAGRFYVAFEGFGTPVGFDFHAAAQGGAADAGAGGDAGAASAREMGARVRLADGPVVLRVARPSVHMLDAALPQPAVRTRLLRADAAMGWVEVAAGEGPTLEHTVTQPGAYRAEVRITPHHTRPYLPRLERLAAREQPWVYGNPIYVE